MFEFEFAARVDRGLVRKTNQDMARANPRLRLALVADGMGGHDHGDIASRIAAEVLEESFDRYGGGGADVSETMERLRAAFQDANQRLREHPQAGAGGQRQMGTTLVAAVFSHGRAVIGNIGDSRCYRLHQGTLELLTQDHSYAAELKKPGRPETPDDREVAGRWAHVLTRCLNGAEDVDADIRSSPFEPGDVFLLCSDGLWGSVAGQGISQILSAAQDAEDACDRLVGAAWAGGGLDNIGIAIVRIVPLQPHLDEPSWLEQSPHSANQAVSDA